MDADPKRQTKVDLTGRGRRACARWIAGIAAPEPDL